ATRKWFEEYLRWMAPASPATANRRIGGDNSIWRAALEAEAATFAENAPAQRRVFDSYRGRAFPRPPRAGGRGAAILPAPVLAASLEARATICRIAQLYGVDLWSLPARNDGTIATPIDSLEASLADPKQWS